MTLDEAIAEIEANASVRLMGAKAVEDVSGFVLTNLLLVRLLREIQELRAKASNP